jgi:predicted phosphoribosyltransferase
VRFVDRGEAGRALGARLVAVLGPGPVVVLGLPRGGVVVAAEVAAVLGAPLDALVVRKLPLPGRPELAMGAIAAGVVVRNEAVLRAHRPDPGAVAAIEAAEQLELTRREHAYRGDRPRPDLAGRIVVLVDDGIATGSTARAALRAVRAHAPARVVLAAPVAPATLDLRPDADLQVAVRTPRPFGSVSDHYLDFTPTTDEEVRRALDTGRRT